MNKVPVIIPIREIASEFVERLSLHTQVKINDLFFKIILEETLVWIVNAYLEDNLNTLIKNKVSNKVEEKLEVLANLSKLSINDLEKLLFSSFGYRFMFRLLEEYVDGGEWDVYEFSKIQNNYILKYVGNYIQMEWEREHVRNGVYSKIPYVSTDES
jgi:hypothetical protein